MKPVILLCWSLLLAASSLPAAQPVPEPGKAAQPAPPEKRELLSKHDTVAEFVKNDYVDREGSKFPDRPVTRLEALKPGEDPAAVKP